MFGSYRLNASETFFLIPVRFIIDGTDVLLRQVNEPMFISSDEDGGTRVVGTQHWESVRFPLLDFATQRFQAVKDLSRTSHTKYPAPGGWNLFASGIS